MDYIAFKPIGIIYSQHVEPEKTPIQPVYAEGCEGKIKVYQEYAEGLKDLSGFVY